jgi:tartrate dehydrogenase/decarboxylase/D-malate dehydrogenase
MPTHKIAVIAGDGVGQEVIPEAKRVLAALSAKHGFTLEYTDYDWGFSTSFENPKPFCWALSVIRGCPTM